MGSSGSPGYRRPAVFPSRRLPQVSASHCTHHSAAEVSFPQVSDKQGAERWPPEQRRRDQQDQVPAHVPLHHSTVLSAEEEEDPDRGLSRPASLSVCLMTDCRRSWRQSTCPTSTHSQSFQMVSPRLWKEDAAPWKTCFSWWPNERSQCLTSGTSSPGLTAQKATSSTRSAETAPPVDKVKDLTRVMVSLLNSGKRVGSPSENFVLAAGDAGELPRCGRKLWRRR